MPDKKKDKATLQIIFSSILLSVIFLVELYAMINEPKQFTIIGIVGILFIVCLYVLIQGILFRLDMKKQEESERYDNIIKSEKATYLILKKYFGEIEDKLTLIQRTSKVPTEEIVGTQKGIGKVIINRSRENAEAIIASNDILVDRFNQFEETIEENNDKVIASYKSIGDENINQLLMKQQDIILSLKDMELRLNTAIMQSQKVVAAAPQIVAAPMPVVAPVEEAEEPVAEPKVIPEPEVVPEPEVAAEPEPIVEPEVIPEPEIVAEPEPEAIPEPEIVAEPEPESAAPEVDLSDPNKMMSPDDIAALLASMGGDDSAAEEPVAEPEVVPEPEVAAEPEPEAIPEPEVVAEPEPESAAPEVDLSDPNKQLSADEIAALFASIGN